MKHSTFFSGSIDTPPRSSLAGTAIVLSVVTALSLTMIAPDAMGKWTLASFIVLMSLAIMFRAIYAIHIVLLALIWVTLAGFVPSFRLWPLSILMPLVVYASVVALVPALRHSVGWLRLGRFGADVRRLIVIAVVVSGVALVVWTVLEKPDLNHHLALIPRMPLWVYPFAAIGFAFFNAAMEEVIFRGIMMEALDSAIGEGFWSVGAQAVSFAALHFLAGFPNGLLGFVMVLLYGFMLGIVRWRSRGMLASWITHVVADIAIFAILAVIFLQHDGNPMA